MSFFDRFRRTPPPVTPPRPREPEPEPIHVPEVSAAEAAAALQGESPPILLDVRQRWDSAHMRPAGSVVLPLNEIPMRLDELDPNQPYILSCYHGYTSLDGAAWLIQHGFSDVSSLRGGFAAWAAEGLPVERDA